MPGIVALVLIVVPLLEFWVILTVADRIGVVETIVSLIAVAAAGTWLLTRQGVATWRALRAAMNRGELPTKELTDAALLVVAGALLLTPGFLTDIVGLWLLFPPTRAASKTGFRRLFAWWMTGRFGRAGVARRTVYDTNVTRVKRKGEPATPESPDPSAPTLPSSEHRDDGGGSPDKG
jgi:UPF0716 protein FxsA